MRRHLAIQPTEFSLSVEEEAIMLDEQHGIVIQMTALDAEGNRVLDTDQSIVDAQTVAAAFPELTDIDKDLMGAVAEMAVSGTVENPEDVFDLSPAGLSIEGIASTVKDQLIKFWETLKAMIAKAWEHIKSFFSKITLFFSPTKRKLERLKKEEEETKKHNEERARVNEANRAHWEAQEVQRQATIAKMYIDYKGDVTKLWLDHSGEMTSPPYLARDLKDLYQFVDHLLTTLPAGLIQLGESILKASSNIDIHQPEMNGGYQLLNAFTKARENVMNKLGIDGPRASADISSRRTRRLGGIDLRAWWTREEYSFNSDGSGAMENTGRNIAHLGRLQFAVDRITPKGSTTTKLKVLPETTVHEICEITADWSSKLEKHHLEEVTKKMFAISTQLNERSEAMLRIRDSLDRDKFRNSRGYVHDLMSLCLQYSNWVIAISTLIRFTTEITDATLEYCLQSNSHRNAA